MGQERWANTEMARAWNGEEGEVWARDWERYDRSVTGYTAALLDAAAIRLQGVVLPGIGEFPVQAVQALPYLLTVVLLAGFVGRATPPRASGEPYVKER